jgi:hypothetical protein
MNFERSTTTRLAMLSMSFKPSGKELAVALHRRPTRERVNELKDLLAKYKHLSDFICDDDDKRHCELRWAVRGWLGWEEGDDYNAVVRVYARMIIRRAKLQ